MKHHCYGCGVEKDTETLESGSDCGLIPDLIPPLFALDCDPMVLQEDWRAAVVCHGCFQALDPDLWISRACWESLRPVVPFESLPVLQGSNSWKPEDYPDPLA